MRILATIALVCQAVSTCAVPIFAFLLVEGFLHTSDWKRYLTRVSLMALAAEIPYNLAMSSKLIDLSSRNPAFGLVLSFVLDNRPKSPEDIMNYAGLPTLAVIPKGLDNGVARKRSGKRKKRNVYGREDDDE